MATLDAQLEAVLFWKGEPIRRTKLMDILNCDEAALEKAVAALDERLSGRGITLQIKDNELTLGTAKELSAVFEKLTREELSRDLGKAGSETLAIILYKGPISRREIDYIRGVNSTFIIRNLLVRDLIERLPSKSDERVFLYRRTFNLLSFLGLKHELELPEFEKIKAEIEDFEAELQDEKKLEAITEENTKRISKNE